MENNIYKKLFEVKKAGIKLQRDTKAFNYHYADLSQIQEKLWEELQKQWLLVVHKVMAGYVTTEIHNIENDEMVVSQIIMSEDIKPQDKGSEITYYRRYNLLSLLDLEVVDDDGKKAQDSKPKQEEDDKPWIDDLIIDKIADTIANTWEFPTIKQVRSKYKVSKANATRLESMGVK